MYDAMPGKKTAPPRDRRSDALRNRQELIRAATAAFHRDGLQVPMSTIAADAGVGVGTLYRHFATREDLLAYLTHRSFEQVLANVRSAEVDGIEPIDSLRRFVDAAITQRNDLVLPLHGGPSITSAATSEVRRQVHDTLRRIIDRGIDAGVLRPDTTPNDVVILGSMLAQPRRADPDWDRTCHRLLEAYLRGIRQDRPAPNSLTGMPSIK